MRRSGLASSGLLEYERGDGLLNLSPPAPTEPAKITTVATRSWICSSLLKITDS